MTIDLTAHLDLPDDPDPAELEASTVEVLDEQDASDGYTETDGSPRPRSPSTSPEIGQQNECYAVILRRFDVPGVMAGNLLWIERVLSTLFPRGDHLKEDDSLKYRMQSPLSLDNNRITNVQPDNTDDTSLVSLGQLQQLIKDNT